ncbi:unnamed protein product [Soboliphyme baturini]|uniref:Etoposide-induced protein 2.4 n=1 Tax=Soboliphyme baturini TaxID=241478 RepID=A0A183IGK1_9BILA|nr:unnamed protein product [Soboliphyme baturini]
MALLARHFVAGLFDSVSGFQNLLTLRRQSGDGQRTNDAFPEPPLSVLATRRLLNRSLQARSSYSSSLSSSTLTPTRSSAVSASARLVQCVLLNLSCIFVLHWVMLPLLDSSSAVARLCNTFWKVPPFIIFRVVNALWFQDIANAVLRHRPPIAASYSVSFSEKIADFVTSLMVEFTFLLQTYLVALLPLPGLSAALTFVHMCLLYSLYAFEYLWVSNGVLLNARLVFIQNSWPYYVGFGFLLSLLTSLSSSVFNSSCVFSIFFPVFILSSLQARPPATIANAYMPLNLFAPSVVLCKLFLHIFLLKWRRSAIFQRTFRHL